MMSFRAIFFGEIDFTFENTTSEWIRIKHISIDFGDPLINKAVQIPVSSDLISWAKAAEQIKQVRDYNTNLVLGSVMAAGALAAGTQHDPSVRALGAGAMLGGAGGLTVLGLREQKRGIELAKLVPSSHLLSDDFVIPPGLHAKKWVTFYTRDPNALPYLSTIIINYTLENGKTERARLAFRSGQSKWQSEKLRP